MTGDQDDMLARLRSLLPPWFPSEAPILDAVLSGFATAAAWIYSLISYVTSQTRIATMSGPFLDVLSFDFFGFNLLRRSSELDASFKPRIVKEIFRPHQTRASLSEALTDLTGNVPIIIEPWNPNDTGALGMGTFALAGQDFAASTVSGLDVGLGGLDVGLGAQIGVPAQGTGASFAGYGMWGSTDLPYQVFITAYRPASTGIPNSSGFDIGTGGLDVGLGLQEIDMSQFVPLVSDAEILATVRQTQAAGVTAWTAIVSTAIPGIPAVLLPPQFVDDQGFVLLDTEGDMLVSA